MKDRKSIICLTMTIGCMCLNACSTKVENLYGNWGVLEVIYQESDISGYDLSRKVKFGHTMTIHRRQKFITLPIESNRIEFGHFEIFEENGNNYLKIFDATDSRFNDVYRVTITHLNPERKGISKTFEIELESDDMYILGRQTVVDGL